MPYSAKINRANPSCFLFVIDESGSMDESMESGRSKAQFVADVLNKTLAALIPQCTKADGVRAYFDVGVITYSGFGVGSGFGGNLSEGILHPISVINKNPIRIEEHNRKVEGGMISRSLKFPVWFEPMANGKTPMCQAMTLAGQVLKEFMTKFPNCYPPLVINITDGQANDGDPQPLAAALRTLSSSDGPALVFNAHLSSSPGQPVIFPGKEAELSDPFAKLLFRMSSQLPQRLLDAAKGDGYLVQPTARGFVFNADLVSVIRFLDIGTRVAQTVR